MYLHIMYILFNCTSLHVLWKLKRKNIVIVVKPALVTTSTKQQLVICDLNLISLHSGFHINQPVFRDQLSYVNPEKTTDLSQVTYKLYHKCCTEYTSP